MHAPRFLFLFLLVLSAGARAGFWALDVSKDNRKLRICVFDVVGQRLQQPLLVSTNEQIGGRSVFPLNLGDTEPLADLRRALQGISVQADGTVLLGPDASPQDLLIRTKGKIHFTGGAALGPQMEQADLSAFTDVDQRYQTILRPKNLHVDLTSPVMEAGYTMGEALNHFIKRKGNGDAQKLRNRPNLLEYVYPRGAAAQTTGQGFYGEVAAELTVLSFPRSLQLSTKYGNCGDNGIDGLFIFLDEGSADVEELIVSESQNRDKKAMTCPTLFKNEIRGKIAFKIEGAFDKLAESSNVRENYLYLQTWLQDRNKRTRVFFLPYRLTPYGTGHSLCLKAPDDMPPVAVGPVSPMLLSLAQIPQALPMPSPLLPTVLPNVGTSRGGPLLIADSPLKEEGNRALTRLQILESMSPEKAARLLEVFGQAVERAIEEELKDAFLREWLEQEESEDEGA